MHISNSCIFCVHLGLAVATRKAFVVMHACANHFAHRKIIITKMYSSNYLSFVSIKVTLHRKCMGNVCEAMVAILLVYSWHLKELLKEKRNANIL